MSGTKDFLRKLSNAHGVSGHEDSIREIVRKEIEDYTDEIRIDGMGNLIAVKNGKKPSIMMAAHMDEIGLVIKYIDKNGFINFVKFGGWFDQTLLNNRVVIHSPHGNFYGVIGSKPPHLMEEEERKKIIKAENMFIDIGAKDEKEVEELGIRPGTPVTLDRDFRELQGSRVTGKAMDNRAGIVMMVEALKRTKTNAAVYAVGTVQEEVGLKGAKTSAFGLNPDVALVSETAIAGDCPGLKEKDSSLKLGEGPVITVTDASGRGLITVPPVMKWLEDTAKENNIPCQLDVSSGGTTDAATIHLTRAGILCGVISVPTRYMHSGVEVIDVTDLEKSAELMAHALETAGRYFSI
ncbi:MAG: M42 family metallopeptidase [Candidatus Thermoplasmatota archaeon]|nr:M42 family metallopeptidase [Candidatus Thermoplasmatota archaeon]